MPETAKEILWQSCREKRCCYFYAVFPTGLDVWRISTTLRIPPWSFTVPVAVDAEAPGAFVLDRSGQHFRAALAKVPTRRKDETRCIFLMTMADGFARCGLGDSRPTPCQSFPSVLLNGVLYVQNDGCTCRRWSLADLDVAEETDLLLKEIDEREVYHRLVDNWNEYVRQSDDDADPAYTYTYIDFCRFLMESYARLSALPLEERPDAG